MLHKVPYTNFHDLNLDWIVTEMKRISDDIKLLNEWKATRDERDAEIDRQLADLNARFIVLENLYNTFVQEVNDRFDELSAQITTQVNELEERITTQVNELEAEVYRQLNALRLQLEQEMQTFKQDVNALLSVYNIRIQAVEQGLEDIIHRLPDMFTIIDPFTGEENSIVNVIYEIVDKTKTNALTATEYDNKNILAENYDALEITAYDYDFNGKAILI